MENARMQAYNTALMGILQNEGSLMGFLDVMFGFLSSSTDFFCVMKHEKQKYGFPKGKAKELILKYFDKYAHHRQRAEMELEKRQVEEQRKIEEAAIVEEPVIEEIVETEVVEEVVTGSKPDVVEDPPKIKEVEEVQPTTQEDFQKHPDSFNGAVRENYTWSQNYEDVDIKVKVPKYIKKAKQVKVDIQRNFLSVGYEDEDKKFQQLINSKLHQQIKLDESLWSLEPSKALQITLTKDKQIWWKTLIVDEEEIDIQKIAAERPMTDLADDEKQVINKMQFDEHQKRLGKPQSHELKVHDMLKKGWNSEGSPFKGQDFDPKMFNISPSAVSQ